MIDTHCHLTYPGLVDRLDDVFAGAAQDGVHGMISVGTSPQDAAHAAEIAEHQTTAERHLWWTAGLHPGHSQEAENLDQLQHELRALLRRPRCVAIGECGLDKHYPDPPIDLQRPAFEAQLAVAAEEAFQHFPVIIHNREATDDTLAVLRASGLPGDRFVFHCFTGAAHELDAILDFGAMVSFTGIVTFNSARDLADASDRVPLDRLMLETDAPYLTPAPHRKVRPNEPRYSAVVGDFLANRRGMPARDFKAACDNNAKRFFNLSD
ncbi:MAG: TatD family hydrolase [Planctomycetota bacterium]